VRNDDLFHLVLAENSADNVYRERDGVRLDVHIDNPAEKIQRRMYCPSLIITHRLVFIVLL